MKELKIAGSSSRPPITDWGDLGRYEDVAVAMRPAAEIVIDRCAPRPGERVLDIGCGTGNAALLAAERGATATGIDPSPRLIRVAEARAAQAGLSARFLVGEAADLPLPDASFDLILDVFSLLFVPDAAAAVAEMVRVTAPEGRIVWTGWVGEGTIVDLVKMRSEYAARAGRPAPPYSRWNDPEELEQLFAPHGFRIALDEASFRYVAPSARDWLEGTAGAHPLFIAGDRVLAEMGLLEEVNARSLALLEKGNEETNGFAVTPRFIIGTARRLRSGAG